LLEMITQAACRTPSWPSASGNWKPRLHGGAIRNDADFRAIPKEDIDPKGGLSTGGAATVKTRIGRKTNKGIRIVNYSSTSLSTRMERSPLL
jgi:hypothetical protein